MHVLCSVVDSAVKARHAIISLHPLFPLLSEMHKIGTNLRLAAPQISPSTKLTEWTVIERLDVAETDFLEGIKDRARNFSSCILSFSLR